MELKRRVFLVGFARSVIAVVAGLVLPVAKRCAPTRFVEALRARRYPGPVVTADAQRTAKTGKWAG